LEKGVFRTLGYAFHQTKETTTCARWNRQSITATGIVIRLFYLCVCVLYFIGQIWFDGIPSFKA